jgi:hypothetical protein
MEKFNDIKSIWHSEKASQLPAADEFVVLVNKYKSKRSRKSFFLLLMLIVCFVLFVNVWFRYNASLWTTKVGEVLVFAIILYQIFYQYVDLKKKKKEESLNISMFLFNLKKEVTEKNEEKKHILFSLSFLCLAYGFFIYENASGSLQSLIIHYTLLLVIFAFLWFVYRPFASRSQQESVKMMLIKIEKLQKQIN